MLDDRPDGIAIVASSNRHAVASKSRGKIKSTARRGDFVAVNKRRGLFLDYFFDELHEVRRLLIGGQLVGLLIGLLALVFGRAS